MAKRKRYRVQAQLDLMVGTEILADSLDDAVEQSKSLKYDDFVTVPQGELIDYEIKITGIVS